MAVKLTLSVDEDTALRLARIAERTRQPKSRVVREAIRAYEASADRLGPAEIARQLAIFDRFTSVPPSRSRRDVERERAELRTARRHPGRLHPQP